MLLVEGRADIEDLDAFLGSLADVGAETGTTVQAFDARYVLGRAHLERAVARADRAIRREQNVAHDRGMEIMLYAAGRRQIDRALTMGAEAGDRPLVVLVDAPDDETTGGTDGEGGRAEGDEDAAAAGVRDHLTTAETLGVEHVDTGLVRRFFDVSEAELAAAAGDLQSLVLERVALLDVEK